MKTLLVAILSLFGCFLVLPAEVSEGQLVILADNYNNPKQLEELIEDKAEIIAYLKEWNGSSLKVAEGKYLVEKNKLLGNLGDPETIQALYDDYLTGTNVHGRVPDREDMKAIARVATFNRLLIRIRHPEILIVLGGDVNRPVTHEKVVSPRGDSLEVPYSNALVILNVLKSSGFFSQEVVLWAKSLEGDTILEQIRLNLDLIRAFWEFNKEAIEMRDYDEVVVPLFASKSDDSTEPVEIISKGRTVESNIKDAGEVVPEEIAEEAPEESTDWLLWFIGVLVVLGGLVVVARRKS